jgi:hypothetical protein
MEAEATRPLETMSTNSADDTDAPVPDQSENARYAELNIGDEEFVIYDRENHQAWIQSSVAHTIEERR